MNDSAYGKRKVGGDNPASKTNAIRGTQDVVLGRIPNESNPALKKRREGPCKIEGAERGTLVDS